jgi:hypothetical protein
MTPGPFDSTLDPQTRRALGARLRLLLDGEALDVRAMAAGLGVEPELVVVALRELRHDREGHLRTAVSLGRVTWQWEAHEVAPEPEEGDPLAPVTSAAAGRKKGKRKRA